MALVDLQNALAEIFTSRKEMSIFFSNKQKWISSRNQLNDLDKKLLLELKKQRVLSYVDGLEWKRIRNITDNLPLFSAAIGFRRLIRIFNEYSDSTPLVNGAHHEYRTPFIRDVKYFCLYITENKSRFLKNKEWLSDLAYYESQKLNDKMMVQPLASIIKKLDLKERKGSKKKGNINKKRLSAE